jgi:hypothetical protein
MRSHTNFLPGTTSKTIAVSLILTLVCSFAGIAEAQNRWEDHSDELPGMYELDPLMIIVGIAATGLLIHWFVQNSDKDIAEEEPGKKNSDEETKDSRRTMLDPGTFSLNSTASPAAYSDNSRPLKMMLKLKQDGVGLGVKFNF